MTNPLDTDVGSELFTSYEAELKLVQADLSQKLDQITELSGEPRKSAVRLAQRTLDEAQELVSAVHPQRINGLLPPHRTLLNPLRCTSWTSYALSAPTSPRHPVPKLISAFATTNPTSTLPSGDSPPSHPTAVPSSESNTQTTLPPPTSNSNNVSNYSQELTG